MRFCTPLLLTALAGATPLLAQSPPLPDRPIARGEVIAAVKRQFAMLDANHDGVVSRAEFDAYRARIDQLRAAGREPPSDPFTHVGSHWFEHNDANGDGRVTLAEATARPLQMFDMADVNHDGVVSTSEAKIATLFSGH